MTSQHAALWPSGHPGAHELQLGALQVVRRDAAIAGLGDREDVAAGEREPERRRASGRHRARSGSAPVLVDAIEADRLARLLGHREDVTRGIEANLRRTGPRPAERPRRTWYRLQRAVLVQAQAGDVTGAARVEDVHEAVVLGDAHRKRAARGCAGGQGQLGAVDPERRISSEPASTTRRKRPSLGERDRTLRAQDPSPPPDPCPPVGKVPAGRSDPSSARVKARTAFAPASSEIVNTAPAAIAVGGDGRAERRCYQLGIHSK